MKRRAFLALLAASAAWADEAAPRVIPVTVHKFEFVPAELALKLGEPVVLELTTEDVHMGFDAPALGLHADILPGRVARVPFTPSKEGSFEFACDVFCGSGHEEMGGVIIVRA
ncbi:MAG TPA: cupredoxin domain-containing protein [Burkholderiales bacterium]|nr:cupredoxin domain-containing protein [Burkholderiales bacterium]